MCIYIYTYIYIHSIGGIVNTPQYQPLGTPLFVGKHVRDCYQGKIIGGHTYTRHAQQKLADTHMSLLCTPPRQPFCNTWHNRAGQSLARSHALPLHSYKCVRVRGGSRQLRQDNFSLGCCDHIFCDFKWGGCQSAK